eukprot:PITA_16127
MTVVRGDVKFDEDKAMICSLEREMSIPLEKDLLDPKEEPQDELQEVLEQPHAEEQTGGRVEAPNQPESSREGRKSTEEANRLVHDVRDNVGSPTSQCSGRIESIMKKSSWEVVLRPEGKLVVGSTWIYKVKHEEDRRIEKYKAKFVAKGSSQVEGVDYEENFSPVGRYSLLVTFIAY